MSSEMRELLRKWKFTLRLLGPDVARRVLESCIADVDALLARTEAGADGAVAWQYRKPGGRWETVSKSTFDKYRDGSEYEWRELFTHPQDASGDARPAIFDEASDRVAFVDAHTWPENGFKNVWITHAMQAKEAK